MKVFIDTGMWFGYLVRNDQHHQEARQVIISLQAEGILLVTSDLILSETYTLLMRKLDTKAALKFLDIIRQQVEERFTQIIWVDDAILKEARMFLEKFSDHPLTLADASSAAILRRKNIPRIATFDHHFKIMGFSFLP
ncbi:PIN domain-containing protein [Moorella naiadis]|uniref:type II toxin-antitoxin system VapC family toxin n=1 Tax=Moorella naiadis (nom. illeg.) TaxID=3093670 RepID=UPI003D9C7EEB